MSSNELAHLFPSATHPALPVAASILSTLRALTAPGKGNDLRAEERAALVGVAALLACERIQSHDLAQTAVQRATSVAPAHFKSALAAARKLLAANDTNSPSRRSQPSTPSAQRVSTMPTPTPPSIKLDPLSPFMTPRKKFRATSSRDLAGLLTPHKHSPAASSPLRTVTRKRGAEEETTPSKRARVDEPAEEEDVVGDPQTPSRRSARAAAKMREREGAAAFLALRPGRQPQLEVVEETEDENGAPRLARPDLSAEIDGVLGRRTRRRLRPRRDWTFRESVWAPDREGMERILASVEVTDKGKGKAEEFGAQLAALLAR